MLLLKGKTLEAEIKFTPESMSLELVDAGVSTATMTLGPDAPEIALGRWLRDDTAPGKGIVWRVKSVDTAYDSDTRTVRLEHIVATLKDGLIFGEMGSKESAMPAKTAVQNVLARQSLWALGSFEYSRSLPYSFNNTTYYAAIESVCGTLEDSRWEYDLSKLPFRLNIVKKSGDVASEMRATRNLQTIRRTVDTTGMFTRFYPVGARNLHISGDYVQKNTAIYGVIARTETDQSIENEQMLREWALHRLRRHCEPTVTIAIKGLDLSQSTGEALDGLTIGRMCRVPLPEYDTVITQYIIRLSWGDKIKAPEDVTVTLSNHRTDATSNLAQTLKEMSSSHAHNSGGGARAAEEDHAWIVDTTDKVGLVAEAIIGRDPDGNPVDWSRVSEIIVDGEGIHQRVVATQDELVVAEASIEVNEKAITAEVKRANDAEGKLSGRISVTAAAITSEVTRATEAEGDLSTRITQTADKVQVIATDEDVEEFIKGGGEGSMLSITKDNIETAVGRIEVNEGSIATITGSALWQNRDGITAAAGKLTVSGNKLRLVDGASLEIKENGVYNTVGSVKYIDDQISTITGSQLWVERDNITAVTGKMSLTTNGNVVVDGAELFIKDADGKNRNVSALAGQFSVDKKTGTVTLDQGAELQVYAGDKTRSITALAGKVRVTDQGNVMVEGASLYVKDTEGENHNVTAVAGKFNVKNGDVHVIDGSRLYVDQDGTGIEVVDKGNVITAIRASKEGVQIQASKVDLGDYATVSELDTQKARITNLKNGTAVATYIKTKSFDIQSGGEFHFHGKKFNMSSITYVSSINFTAPSLSRTSSYDFMYSTGPGSSTFKSTAKGAVVTNWSEGSCTANTRTKYFLVEED